MRHAIMALAGLSIIAPLVLLLASDSSSKSPDTGVPRTGLGVGSPPSVGPRDSTLVRADKPFAFRVKDYGPASSEPNEPAPEVPALEDDSTETPSDPAVDMAYATTLQWHAYSLFEMLDSNGDGQLTGNELPPSLRSQLNDSPIVDAPLFAVYFQTAVLQAAENNAGAFVARGPITTSRGFASLDADGDGQVSLYEWRAAGRSPAEFRRLDTDGDGLLTPRETRSYTLPPTDIGIASSPKGSASPPSSQPVESAASRSISPSDMLFSGFVYQAVQAKPATSSARPTAVASHSASAPAPLPTASNAVVRNNTPARKSQPIPAPARVAIATPAPAPAAPAPASLPSSLLASDQAATMALTLRGTPHWQDRDDANVEALLSGVKPDVLFLGDSITELLQYGDGRLLWPAFYEPLGALNFGIGGITTSEVLWQIETGEVAYAAPKVIVLSIGTNNLGLGQSPDGVAAGIAKIVEELNIVLPHTRILLVGILPRGASPTDSYRSKIARTNDLIAPLADGDRVTYIDIGDEFLSSDGSISPDIMSDYVHPTLWGYEIYTTTVWPLLVNLLNRP